MPKRSRTTKPKTRQPKADPNRAAFDMLQHVIEETEGTNKNPLAVAMGRLGGLKGGKARADKMTDEERSVSASKAAKARWAAKKR